MKKFKNKNKRGFSLVELMVVVAIMGTLASIAIPAYNAYRKSAKKTAYRTDMLSLHKGWLAFGVEQDSFCTRDTNPQNSSIENVGMESLLTSKLYGTNQPVAQQTESCSGGGTLDPAGCTGAACTGCTGGTNPVFTPFRAAIPAGNGPGKHNFIGFGTDACSPANLAGRQVQGAEGTTWTTVDAGCDLNVSTYELGVYGHLSGEEHFGISVNENGVVSAEASVSTSQQNSDASCT